MVRIRLCQDSHGCFIQGPWPAEEAHPEPEGFRVRADVVGDYSHNILEHLREAALNNGVPRDILDDCLPAH